MGLIACRARLMLEAKRSGVDFASTLTLGRQSCHITAAELGQLRRDYGIPDLALPERALDNGGYADDLFHNYLGVKNLNVMDFSDYQGADVVHDLNVSIDQRLEGNFDVVVDGGTLEHIFNFPVAIANCMRMLKTGGSLFIFSMANNHCGHGFYQFSPELFFRIFQPENGFKIANVILVKHPFPGAELSSRQECFRVTDPATLRRRTSLVTASPLGIMVHAIKTADRPLFTTNPQQSDYAETWENAAGRQSANAMAEPARRTGLRGLFDLLPADIRRSISGYRQLWSYSLTRDSEAYTKWP
jgi:hypothetical protein